jgi:putative ABC transport system permease protein
MVRSYITIAIRHILKSKALSFIHVLGLSIGISAFFFIAQYVNFELSFDQFHTDKDQIFRIALERTLPGNERISSAKNFAGLRKVATENFPEIRAATGFYKTPANTGVLFRYQDRIFNETGGELNADSSFFRVFPDLLLAGDPSTALNDPYSVVLSASMARKIFGNVDPIGQHLQRPDDNMGESDCVVTGVLIDIPANAHFHANFVVPLQYHWPNQEAWKNGFLMTYLRFSQGADPQSVEKRLNDLYRSIEGIYADVKGTRPFLQSMTSIHLSSQLENELEVNGSKNLVYIAAFIGIMVMVIAWINYINLETARFMARAREVGVRRIIGSAKRHLAVQFLIEYSIVFLGSLAISALMIWLMLPDFFFLTGIPLSGITWPGGDVSVLSLTILVIGSLFVGIYPAIFLIRLHPVLALKGKFRRLRGNILRRSLIIIQFCVSMIVVGFLLIINNQLEFMRRANKKFDVEHVVVIRNPTAYSNEEVLEKHIIYSRFGDKLAELGFVQMLTSSSAIPGTEIGFTYVNLLKRNVADPYDPTPYKTLFIDDRYIPFFGLKLLAGRNFDPPSAVNNWQDPWEDDHWLTLILTESAIRSLGFNSPEEAVDQMVEFENFEDHFQKHKIIGVIADYHHEAVKKEIFPMILSPNYGSFQQVYYSIRLVAGISPVEALNDIHATWKAVFPEKPFDYFFLDEYYDRQFKSELQFQKIFTLIAAIAMLIAGLGILAMTVFESTMRVREISIRKVLGASIANLIALLSADYFKAIILSVSISLPFIWLVAIEWLGNYPSRINITFKFFLLPVLVLLAIVAVTSVFHTWKAFTANPVDHLKNE